MTLDENKKRLFFALEAHALWPSKLPNGRILEEKTRHLTLSFLGWVKEPSKLIEKLNFFPIPPFKVGLAGCFDKCLFLPQGHPRIVAWNVKWLENPAFLEIFQKELESWLQQQGFHPDKRHDEFLPHVTIGRAPFDPHHWKRSFIPLPMFIKDLHLYESLGHLQYEPRWTWPLMPPFEEFDHTADIAFQVHAETLDQLQIHAFMALAFKCPELLEFAPLLKSPGKQEDIVANLNQIVAQGDLKTGCPFKAVSYHGEIYEKADGTLTWEMIVDV